MLLLARMSVGESLPQSQFANSPPYANESVAPVPLPPPPVLQESNDSEQDSNERDQRLERSLERQQDVTQRLESQISQQQATIKSLEDQLQRQMDESRAIMARLEDYQQSIDDLGSQQNRLEGAQRNTDQAQNSLVWVGAGLVLMLLMGGGGVLMLLVLWMAQSKQPAAPPNNTVIYSPPMPPPHPYYYEPELLPPAQIRPMATARQYHPQDY